MGNQHNLIKEIEIDRNVRDYTLMFTILIMIYTVVGIPFIPFYVIFHYAWYSRRYMRWHSLKLTDKRVEVRRGVIFRNEANVPLDRITDVTVHQGLLMRIYGLQGITVETAGQTSPGGIGKMIGVKDPHEFREAVMQQRELLLEGGVGLTVPAKATSAPSTDGAVLKDIRDILARIEKQGAKK